MALTERSRAARYRGLSDLLDDEEAVGDVLSYFPTRDADEPASRDVVDARFASFEGRVVALEAKVEAGFAAVESRFASVDARMDARFESVDARMKVGFAEQREAIESKLHAEIAR